MKSKVQTKLANPVLGLGVDVSAIRAAAVERMSAAEVRAWAASPSGRASLASMLKGAGPTVQARAVIVHQETWGAGAGYSAGEAPAAPAALLPVAGELVTEPERVPLTAEHVAANRYAAELAAADAEYQASVSRDTLTAEAKALAAAKGETGARVAKESRERAKVSAARVRAAKERGPSQSWADDVARLLERTAEDSIERLCVSVAWRMASKAVRRVEGGARKRSKAAQRVETVAGRVFLGQPLPDGFEGPEQLAGVATNGRDVTVTTGETGETFREVPTSNGCSRMDSDAKGWTGRAAQLSDTAKAEAFGAALEACQIALCAKGRGAMKGETVEPLAPCAGRMLGGWCAKDGRTVSHFGALCGIAYRAAFRSLTRLDGGGTGRKTGGEQVVSSDTESGAASVARFDAGQAIADYERAARFATLPPVGLDAQRERAGKVIAYRYGLTNGGEGAEGCDGCRALVGLGGKAAHNLRVQSASRRAVAGALVSVLGGSEPEAARARWGAGQSAFASALRSLGLAVSSDKRGLACA